MSIKSKPKKILWWPDTSDEKGLKAAIDYGAYAAIYLALNYLIATLFFLYFGERMNSDEQLTTDEQVIQAVSNAGLILLALTLAWRIWKKSEYFSSIIILIWIGFECLWNVMYRPDEYIDIGYYLLFLCAAMYGVWGALTYRRRIKNRPSLEVSNE